MTTERVDLERTGFRTGLERLRGGRGCVRATGGAVSAEDREEGTFDDDEALSSADADARDAPRQRLRMGSGGCGEVHTARLSEHQGMRARARPRAQEARTQRLWSFATRHVRSVGVPPSVKRRFRGGTRGIRSSLGPSLARASGHAAARRRDERDHESRLRGTPRARAATVADLPRESEERPYIVGELTGEFDPFNDFPCPVAARTTPTTPRSAASSTAASRLLEDVGGHEIVGHHIARLRDHEPAAAGVPNYPPPTGTAPAAWQPGLLPRPRTPPDHHHPGQWQTTAQAQMSGQAAAPRRRSGKRMVPPQGAPTGSPMARGADGVPARRSTPTAAWVWTETGAPSPLARGRAAQERGPAGGLRTETLPFVPGYGGHVPETRGVNFGEAARRGLAQRAPKDLLVENFNPRMPGAPRGRVRGGSEF